MKLSNTTLEISFVILSHLALYDQRTIRLVNLRSDALAKANIYNYRSVARIVFFFYIFSMFYHVYVVLTACKASRANGLFRPTSCSRGDIIDLIGYGQIT